MSDLCKMTFLSYQPMLKREGVYDENEINIGEYRTEAILERDKPFIEKLGYNPYWAIGGKDTRDIILGSLFCAPNSPEMAYIFQTDDYIRINKVKQENIAAGFIKDQTSLDFVDNTQPDIATEFLVKEFFGTSLQFIYGIPSIMGVLNGGHVVDGFVVGREVFSGLSKNIQELWDACVSECYEYIRNNIHIDRGDLLKNNISPDAVDYYIDLQNAKMVFEVTVLPVILECLCPENIIMKDGYGDVTGTDAWFVRCAYTFNSLLDVATRFTDAIYDGKLTDGIYAELANEGKHMILDDNLLNKLLDIGKCYPNDACPCGSGIKFKKCHGRFISSKLWGRQL